MMLIIMGCGRVGEQLANFMLTEGHEVIIVDHDRDALERLGPDFRGRRVRGVGFDLHVLEEAGIRSTEAFVATSSSDNANIVAARIARNKYHVPRVVARLQDPRRAEIYRRLGLITISPTDWGAQRIRELLSHSDMATVMSYGNGEVVLVDIETPLHLVGREVMYLTIPGEVMVVAITRDQQAILPTMGTQFGPQDVIHLAVLSTALPRVEALLGLSAGGY